MTLETLVTDSMESPVGRLTLVASDAGLRSILWSTEDSPRVPVGDNLNATEHPVLGAARQQLEEYFEGSRREFDIPLDPIGTEFQQQAWLALRQIPYGETVSYGQQAERLGDRNKARAVGAANGKNPISIVVPCHRVVGASGSLTGFAGGLDRKSWLLDHERRQTGQTLL